MIHQYYYHNNECKADSAESKDCICWHDEGTGPFVNERHDHKNRRIYNLNLHWRVKPDELADLKLRCEEQQQKLDEMAKAFSQQQDRIKRLEEELESTKADRDSWSNQSDEFAKTAADLIIRIKRLEEAGDAMDKTAEPFVLDTIDEDTPMSKVGEQYEIIYDSPPTAGDHVAMDLARKDWRKAKEAKP